ncbi:MAG: HIT family protein [bacterium]
MPDCIFCKIIAGELPSAKVYEDEDVIVFLDIAPVNPGHTLVVPKKHYADFLELPDDLVIKLILTIKKMAPAVMKGLNVTGFNLGLNNGGVAGQIVDHCHFHIMPRLANDGRQLWYGQKYEMGEMEETAQKIRKSL